MYVCVYIYIYIHTLYIYIYIYKYTVNIIWICMYKLTQHRIPKAKFCVSFDANFCVDK